jgi:acyl carrier protein
MGSSLAQLAITPAEGMQAFQRVLSRDRLAQIVVSTGDLQSRIDQWIKLIPTHHAQYSTGISPSSDAPRPNRQNGYIAPSSELEQAIADVWREVLGIDQVGIHDNFFELGGHSLLAMQVVARIRASLHVVVSLPRFFETPTVEGLASVITQDRMEMMVSGAAEDLLTMLEGRDNDRVQRRLADQT